MPEVEPQLAFPKRTLEFFYQAIAEGAHLKIPGRINEQKWIDQRNLFGSYIFTAKSLRDVAHEYHKFWQSVNVGMYVFTRRIHQNCSPELQTAIPLDSIDLTKKRVEKPLISRGPSAAAEIERITQVLNNPDSTIEEIQQALNDLTISRVMTLRAMPDSPISPLTEPVRAAKLHAHPSRFSELAGLLSERNIPNKKFQSPRSLEPPNNYIILPKRFVERATEVFRDDPSTQDLKPPRIWQIGGPTIEPLPTIVRVRQPDYQSAWSLLEQAAVQIDAELQPQFRLDQIFDRSCPTPVFKTKTGSRVGHYCLVVDQHLLRNYFSKRLIELSAGLP